MNGSVTYFSDGEGVGAVVDAKSPDSQFNGTGILLVANPMSGAVSLIGIPPQIHSFTFIPSTLDIGQSTEASLVVTGGAWLPTVSYQGLPTGCVGYSTPLLECTPTENGTFIVRAEITDAVGESVAASTSVTVGAELSLTARFGAVSPDKVDIGQEFPVSARATGGIPPYAYGWIFGDGTTAVGENATHEFTLPGIFVISSEVTDSAGATSSVSEGVSVFLRPTVVPDGPFEHTTDVGVFYPLYADISGGAPGGDAMWNLGDGTTLTGPNVTHAWSAKGTYVVHLTYRDGVGTYANGSVTILVDPPLGGTFDTRPEGSSTGPGASFYFTAQPSGGTLPYAVNWSFGNGSYKTGTNVSASFATPGIHTVSVTVRDAAGGVVTSEVAVDVSSARPSAPSPFGGNFGPGVAVGVFLGATAAAALLYTAERSRRRKRPSPPSPYVPPAGRSPPGKGA